MGRHRGVPPSYREPKAKLHPVMYALRKLRITSGVTQGDLALRAGYSIRTMESWEDGTNYPSIVRADDMAKALGARLALVDADGREITFEG